jgi:hypothetical protein
LKTEIPGVGDVGDEPLAVVIGPRIGAALSLVFAGTVVAALGSAAGAGSVEVGGCFEQAAPNPRMNDRIKRLFIFVPVFAEKRDQNRSLRCRRAFATRLIPDWGDVPPTPSRIHPPPQALNWRT